VFDIRPEGSRKIERPKLRWEDGVIQDIRQDPGREELEECGYEQRRLAESSEEVQGPHRTVEPIPMMMMMMMRLLHAR
jgi:hypothetical protein